LLDETVNGWTSKADPVALSVSLFRNKLAVHCLQLKSFVTLHAETTVHLLDVDTALGLHHELLHDEISVILVLGRREVRVVFTSDTSDPLL
jgi:hypothetical protein